MKMIAKAPDMIFVRMTKEKRINIKSALRIARQATTQIGRYVRRVVILFVGIATNVDVDQDSLPFIQAY